MLSGRSYSAGNSKFHNKKVATCGVHLYYRDAPMHASPTVYASRIQRFRLPRVCVAVVGEDASNMIDRAESLVRDNPFHGVQVRLPCAAGRRRCPS